jgi:hypothetical protein
MSAIGAMAENICSHGGFIWTQSGCWCNFERVLISLKRGRRIFGEVSRSGMSME